MNTYYQIIGTINGQKEILDGSFDRKELKYTLDAERDSWKEEGYKKIGIVSSRTEEDPDMETYKIEKYHIEDAQDYECFVDWKRNSSTGGYTIILMDHDGCKYTVDSTIELNKFIKEYEA